MPRQPPAQASHPGSSRKRAFRGMNLRGVLVVLATVRCTRSPSGQGSRMRREPFPVAKALVAVRRTGEPCAARVPAPRQRSPVTGRSLLRASRLGASLAGAVLLVLFSAGPALAD